MRASLSGPAIIGVAGGGTGISTYAVGDLLYANTTSSLARLADVATGSVLVSGGVGVAPAWSNALTLSGTNAALSVQTGGTASADTATFLIPSLGGSGTNTIRIGKALSGLDSFGIGFFLSGSGSTSNRVDFSFFGLSQSMQMFGTGVVALPGAVASTSTTTGTLVVTGGVGVSGALFTGGDITMNSGTRTISFGDAFHKISGGSGSKLILSGSSNGVQVDSAGPFDVASTTEATTGGAGSISTLGGIYATKKIITGSTLTTLGGATFHTTSSALTNGAGAATGTLLTAPSAGNPTKWIGIDDNGTVRYIPAW